MSRLGLAVSRVFHRIVPDPFVIAVGLTLLAAALALLFGHFEPGRSRMLALLDAWRGPDGLWGFLP
ncbi:MAG: hypothetical protein GTO48_06635, partial [Xanthomonadales bacterium]|nr:hypothetical protein [Xanthomonadales bacterium]